MAKDTPSTAHFLRVPTALLDSGLPAGALVLFGLIDNMGVSKGVAWPSITFLSKKLRTHRVTIVRWVHLLEELDVLEVERTAGKVNRYRTSARFATSDTRGTTPVSEMSPTSDTRRTRTSKTNKQKEQAAADHPEPTVSPSNDDRALAEAEARRRQTNGSQIRNFGAYVNTILKDPDVMARLRKPKADEWVTGGQSDPPTLCLHRTKALLPALDDDEPDMLRCVACGQEWQAGLEAVG